MSHLFVLTYDMLTFLCFRSSNKDPGAGRVESLSMKEHTVQVGLVLLIYSSCGVY